MVNPIKLAAWCGVAMLVLSFLSPIINSIFGLGALSYILMILSSAAGVTFLYGFVVLGSKYKQGLLKGFAIYFIVLAVIALIVSIVALPQIQSFTAKTEKFNDVQKEITALGEKYGGEENIPEEEMNKLMDPYTDLIFTILKWFLVFYILFVILYGIPNIFYGIGLLKLKDKVELSKAAGLMKIIGGATTIIFIGGLLIFIGFILEMVILFKESEKTKAKKKH